MIVYRVDEASTRIHEKEVSQITPGSVLFKSGHRVPRHSKSRSYFEMKADALAHMLHWHEQDVIDKARALGFAKEHLTMVHSLREEVSS